MSGLSRRRLLQVPMLAGLGAFGVTACNSLPGKPGSADPVRRVHAPAPDGVLGANFNGAPSENLFGELGAAEATWVRGFFAMPDADKANPARSRAIGTLLRAGAHGYGTVLSLKFPYFPNRGKPLPRKGSEAMKAEFARLDKVLDAVLGKVNILVLGNEPFIECPRPDRNNGALNEFYEAVAGHVIATRAAHQGGDKTALYLGALTKLDEPGEIGKGTERWMSYVRDTPEIAGTDIHPHVGDPAGVDTYLDYVRARLGPDKKFLATEFSLVHLWQKHLTDRVSAEYAAKYHVRPDTKVWQVIKNALDKPFAQQRWYDLLRTSPWFENNRNFLRDQTEKFRATGRLAVATYGVSPDAAMSENFGPDKQPWLLNSLFASRTVRPLADGSPAPNYAWLDEFKALQRR